MEKNMRLLKWENNIFKYQELADNQRASELITTFEEKELILIFPLHTKVMEFLL